MTEDAHAHADDAAHDEEYAGPNVEGRRKAYGWFIGLAVVALIIAAVDILFLGALLKYLVYGVLAILVLLAIILLFARGAPKDETDDEDEFEPISLEDEEHLHCPHCAHVFSLELPKKTKGWKRQVSFTCPECGNKGVLPPANATPVEAVVPGGEVTSRQFRCGVCNEGWSVGVIGHRLKKKPTFDACPSCGSAAAVHVA